VEERSEGMMAPGGYEGGRCQGGAGWLTSRDGVTAWGLEGGPGDPFAKAELETGRPEADQHSRVESREGLKGASRGTAEGLS